MGKERRAQQREFDFNAAEAQKSRDFSHDESQLAREWQTAERLSQQQFQSEQWEKQFEMQNEYNTPANQSRLLQHAGINPSVYFGGHGMVTTNSTGSVSSPSAPSASLPSAAQAHGSAGYPSQIPAFISSVGNFVKDLAGAGLQGAETYQLGRMLNERFRGLVLDNSQKSLVNKGIALNNDFFDKIKDVRVKKAWQEYTNLTADYYLKLSQGDKNVSDVALSESQKRLNDSLNSLKGYEATMLKMRLAQYNQELYAMRQSLLGQAAAGYGSAAYSNAQAGLSRYELSYRKALEATNLDAAQNAAQKLYDDGQISHAQLGILKSEAIIKGVQADNAAVSFWKDFALDIVHEGVGAFGEFKKLGFYKDLSDTQRRKVDNEVERLRKDYEQMELEYGDRSEDTYIHYDEQGRKHTLRNTYRRKERKADR